MEVDGLVPSLRAELEVLEITIALARQKVSSSYHPL